MSVSKDQIPALTFLDQQIKTGNIAEARKLVQDLNRHKIPRSELVKYAGIANRVYEPKLAYRFLHSIIREAKDLNPPSADEKIEFAEALRGMGLIEESLELLKEVDPKASPIIHLRMSFCYMTRWQYRDAIPCLKQYLAMTDSSEYTHTIARVNLAAALINERQFGEAETLLSVLRSETREKNLQLLLGNCLELTAQLFVLLGQFDRAEEIFDEASKTFGDNLARYALYLRKWKAISRSLKSRHVDSDLIECRRIACEDSDWETIRDCNLYIGFLTQDYQLVCEVYFGTPFESYRQRIRDLVSRDFILPEQFVWVADKSEPLRGTFDLLKGGFDFASEDLEPGQLMHRMMILLSRDFYRPLTLGTAFSELFPDEHFFQMGSTNRVSQVIKRLRTWLSSQGSPFTIEESDGSYRLKPAAGIGIQMRLQKPELNPQALTWEKFKKQIGDREFFTRNDVVSQLNCSPTGASRLIQWSVETNHCEPVGAGRQRKYRIAS